MAIGDDATAAGLPLVPNTGEEGKVKWGAREINRTRDFIAQVKDLIPGSKGAFRAAAGITQGTATLDSTQIAAMSVGDIYLKIIIPE